MAEHLRHKLAREGFVLRPNLILTLSQFLAPWVEDLPRMSPAALYLLVERVALRLAPPEFARVLRTPGFCAALAQAVEEFSAAGCDARRLERSLPRSLFGGPFVALYKEVERELAARGAGLRSGRLELAARRIAQQGLPGVYGVGGRVPRAHRSGAGRDSRPGRACGPHPHPARARRSALPARGPARDGIRRAASGAAARSALGAHL